LRIQFSNIDGTPLDKGVKAIVHDLSRNGTFVNNVKLVHDTSCTLKAGDFLSLIRGHMDTSSDYPTYAYRGYIIRILKCTNVIYAYSWLHGSQ
jgi:pSer/pThr/pTyr-binding forkhead associated (FHA) protein